MLHFSKSDKETSSSTSWMAWEWGHFRPVWIFGWTALILYNQSLEFTSLIRVSSQLPNELLSLNCTLPLQLLADPIIHKRLVSSKDISGKLSAVSFKIGTWYLTLPSVWPLLSPVVKDADAHTVIVYNQLTWSKSWCEDRIELTDRRKVIPNPEPEKRLVRLFQLKCRWQEMTAKQTCLCI